MRARIVLAVAVAATVLLVPTLAEAAVIYNTDANALLNASGQPTAPVCIGTPDAPLVEDGDPVMVHMPPAPDFTLASTNPTWWRTPPTSDGVWRLAYRSLLWLQPIAFKADRLGLTTTYEQTVQQVQRFYAENPDPGTATATALANANKWGWDEGTSLRRLTTLNCLYSLQSDARLIPFMAAEVKVQQCPRYYGPPCHAIHNHGLMANNAIWRAGDLTQNSAWMDLAESRMKSEVQQAFDAAGFMKEQSSGYQIVNISQWTWAADLIRTHDAAAAAAIDAVVARARNAAAWMYWPSNTRFAQLGGSTDEAPKIPFPGVQSGRSLIDDTYGWMFGRFSWTDPLTSYYAIRFGPFRAYHGTQDRPAVTWGTLGERVLVEPGTYGSDTTNNYVSYQLWVSAQNQATPSKLAFRNVNVTRRASTLRWTNHAHSFTDQQWGPTRPHSRYVAVYDTGTPARRLLIRDTFPNDRALSATDNNVNQYFHLDPTWTLVSRGSKYATFRSAAGHTLRVQTTGSIFSILRGQTRPPAGWHFPAWGVRQAANEILIRRYDPDGTTEIETTLQVS
jgi:hypothetical protein